jgi:putative RecB family exonuclease
LLVAPDYLSASSIATFHQCPLKYKYSRIDNLKEPPTQETLLGTFVHEILEVFYKLNPSDRTIQNARHIASTIWENYKDPATTLTKSAQELKDFRWRAWFCVENLWKVENPEHVSLNGTETEFIGDIDGVKVKGIIDRWVINEEGVIDVSDYKTGKVPRKEWRDDKFDQLVIYGILIGDAHEKEIGSLDLIYLKEGVTLNFSPTQERISKVKEHIVTTRKMIDERCKSEDFEYRTSNLCGWCHFKTICPAWARKHK